MKAIGLLIVVQVLVHFGAEGDKVDFTGRTDSNMKRVVKHRDEVKYDESYASCAVELTEAQKLSGNGKLASGLSYKQALNCAVLDKKKPKISSVLEYIKTQGLIYDSSYDKMNKDPKSCKTNAPNKFKIGRHEILTGLKTEKLKALVKKNAVCAEIQADPNLTGSGYKGQEYSCKPNAKHGKFWALIVGYVDDKSGHHWIIKGPKNSNWGDNTYGKIVLGDGKPDCGITSNVAVAYVS